MRAILFAISILAFTFSAYAIPLSSTIPNQTASLSKRSHDQFTLPNLISARHLGQEGKRASASSNGQGDPSSSQNKRKQLESPGHQEDAAAKKVKAIGTGSDEHPVQDAIIWSSKEGKALGQGGYGQVWTTMYKTKPAVVKIIPFGPDVYTTKEMVKNELFCTKKVDQLLDAGESENTAYLIMPFIDGLSYEDAEKKSVNALTDQNFKEAMNAASIKIGKRYGVWRRDWLNPDNYRWMHDDVEGKWVALPFDWGFGSDKKGKSIYTNLDMQAIPPMEKIEVDHEGVRSLRHVLQMEKLDMFDLERTSAERKLHSDPGPVSGAPHMRRVVTCNHM
ncbi:hypothetical protein H0H93_008215 [Arthromyces matolae]|nr:hypothetical protein H0H93_008215 [Arthromyces matolae]